LHGDLSQAQRDVVMQRFRIGNLQMLIATDVAARGLDVKELTHVINYSLPDDPEIYVHRSGRTGRAGKKGLSLTIAHSREMGKIRALERMVKKDFEKALVPEGKEIVETRLYNLIENIKKTEVDEEKIAPFMERILAKFEDESKEELIKKFVSVEFTRFLNYYKGAKNININGSRDKQEGEGRRSRGRDKDNGKRYSDKEFSRFYINLGSKTEVNPAVLMGIINDNTRTRNIEVGKIDLMKRFSFFEVDKKFEKEIIEGFKNASFRGTKISVELSNARPENTDKDDSGYGKRRKRNKKSGEKSFSSSKRSASRKNRSTDRNNRKRR